jgi:micrococcal nuclease
MPGCAAFTACFGAALVALTAGCNGSDPCGPTKAVVSRVVDGDTIELDTGDKIRYLLIDTPEDTSTIECFGPEATAFNEELVLGKEVTLSYDQECTDRYGRLLAYVSVGGREVNSLLVERGYACVLFIPPDGEDRAQEFKDIETVARAQGRGLWSACSEIPCN